MPLSCYHVNKLPSVKILNQSKRSRMREQPIFLREYNILLRVRDMWGYTVAHLVEALYHTAEDSGFDSRLYH
jgi:hypothetical protein